MKTTVFFLFFLFSFYASQSQIEAVTHDGKVVLLNTDGTWTYKVAVQPLADTLNLDCSFLIKKEIDKMTGKTTIKSESLLISQDGLKTGLAIGLFKSGKEITFAIIAVGASSCINENNTMWILFRDGSKIQLTNETAFNCDGKFVVYFLGLYGKKADLEQLRTKEIESIRVYTTKSYVEETLSENQSKQLMKSFDSIINF